MPAKVILRPEVDSFYSFYKVAVGEEHCRGLACYAARSLNPEAWKKAVAQQPPTYCLGKCYAGPSSTLTRDLPRVEVRSRKAIVLRHIVDGPVRSLQQYLQLGGMRGLERALSMPQAEVIDEVKRSQLRGRGGAYFPTGLKWESAMRQAAPTKYVVVNGDEGDAGAYVDRFLMEWDPYLVIEGALIAAYAIGAGKVYFYIRREYPGAVAAVRRAVEEVREAGYIGSKASRGPNVELEVHVGRGSYVVGEETAMINAIMGRRPEPTPRPPYPTERGLFGMPTVVNNVETLSSVPWIIENGGDAYAELGFSRSRGTKVLSLSSTFSRPGLYEVEFGVSLREVVYDMGGGVRFGKLKFLVVGGPLAGPVLPSELDVKLGVEELRAIGASLGHGNVIAFSDDTSMLEALHEIVHFASFESCGKCFPCRLGTARADEILEEALSRGYLTPAEADELKSIATAMRAASLCGHGQATGDAILSFLAKGADEMVRG
ncbi:Putative sulfur reductase membrane anchor subunit, membrane anchor PsrC-like protein [Acidilobus saccharovorans 345-15]|uniref:Putative sulfur reductase membrane anchor subunit, membrane anchor PsrC-like protein n=1 Tax=Acidilobus saccharovorans (strain DSM 16705 / JCM 18335 / VKM B-2471 / 345-15) TaxID=666510 RepID=D9PZ14_ACIS3|nr:NADH-ubiquinone oxidoreductase-F iron-sulfur binding region domain-containing protein [Acidilobus saccharovorans]ADL19801.1 Putative sulfur reductase membrane anchor subunit, membrane anchor PsrC-like protein [Acidilobus saccharovorans 345-15]